MTTTLADKLLAADDDYATLIDTIIDTAIAAKDRAALNMSNVRALARTKALTLADAWHEVNGATIRADEDALTRAQADLAAERKAWQDATEMATPPAAKGRIDLLIGDLTRARDHRSSLIGAREQAEQERNVAVVARGLAETAAKEAIASAEAAEREVARLTGAGVASDDDLSEAWRGPFDSTDGPGAWDAGRRAVYNLGLAHGRAASPPDASDEEIARALYAATAVPGAYDDLPWSVTEPRQRAGWIAAVTTVIRPRLDALRADVARLTAPGPSSKCPADFASYIRDFGTTEGPYRLGLAHGRTESRAEVDRLTTALATAEKARSAFDFAAFADDKTAWSVETFGPGPRTAGVLDHIRKELTEIAAKPDDVSEWVDVIILAMDGAYRSAGANGQQLVEALVAKMRKNKARTWPDWRTRSEHEAIEHDRTGETAPPPPSPRFVAVKRDEVNGRPASCHRYEDTARHHADRCNDNPLVFVAAHEPPPGDPLWPWAVVDAGATPPAALPQVEAFGLPAVKWTTWNDGDADHDGPAYSGHEFHGEAESNPTVTYAIAKDNGEWSLCVSGKADDPTARVEAAVAVLAGRAEVRR